MQKAKFVSANGKEFVFYVSGEPQSPITQDDLGKPLSYFQSKHIDAICEAFNVDKQMLIEDRPPLSCTFQLEISEENKETLEQWRYEFYKRVLIKEFLYPKLVICGAIPDFKSNNRGDKTND